MGIDGDGNQCTQYTAVMLQLQNVQREVETMEGETGMRCAIEMTMTDNDMYKDDGEINRDGTG